MTIEYRDLPLSELARAARMAGVTFDRDRWGRWHVRCPYPALPPIPVIYAACEHRLAELGAMLSATEGAPV